jgi:hypothetical protein
MDTSGRLFQDPTPELIREKKLVRVDHPTKEQLQRGYVLPKERCPCGSGKMARNCCAKELRNQPLPPIGDLSRWGGPRL